MQLFVRDDLATGALGELLGEVAIDGDGLELAGGGVGCPAGLPTAHGGAILIEDFYGGPVRAGLLGYENSLVGARIFE